jgi:RNA polymerase sigma factor (sigma-70 family)
VRRGDSAAFEVLYDRHSVGVLGFCRHMLGSVQDAEDAVQHAFIAAHADLQRHADREIHFKAWLYTIARNRCLSVLRARRDHPVEDMEIVTDRLTDDVQQRVDLRELLADINKLPADQREALVLSEVGALSHSEVAEVVGCEVSKVKSLVFQARTALIDRRLGRETSCDDIREQIATLRGGALRRSHLRHHLEACPGCSEYREQVRRQRQMLALALPVVPSAALRGHVLGALGMGGGTAAVSTAGVTGLGLAAKSSLAKLGIAALVAGGAAGSAAVVHNGGFAGLTWSSSQPTLVHGGSARAHAAGAKAGAATTAAHSTTGRDAAGGPNSNTGGHTRSESGSTHGFTPVQGGSNGDAARQRAATQGQGNHTGITKTHTPTRTRTQAGQGHTKTVHRKTPVTHTPKTSKGTPSPNASPKAQQAPNVQSTPKIQSEPKSQPPAKTEPAPPAQTAPAPTAPTPTVPALPGNASPNGNANGVVNNGAH